ncbi:hypothetical protein ACS0TY_011282 [Phlomoides rotata]
MEGVGALLGCEIGRGSVNYLGMNVGTNHHRKETWEWLRGEVGLRAEFTKEVGERNNIVFWQDYWVDGECLKVKFNRLYRLSEQKEAVISEMGCWDNGEWVWDFKWNRELSTRNLDRFNNLITFIDRNKPKIGVAERWKWKHSADGSYAVNKAYTLLLDKIERPNMLIEEEQAYKKLWKNWAIKKATITAWRIMKERVATKDNLARSGTHFSTSGKVCPLCNKEEESTRHPFFKCDVTSLIWGKLINWLGVAMVFHENPMVHFLQFCDCLGKDDRAKVAATIWIGITWNIWNLRNNVVFNKTRFNIEKGINCIKNCVELDKGQKW